MTQHEYMLQLEKDNDRLRKAMTAYREALADEEDIEDGPAHPPRPNWAMKAGALFDEIMAKNGVRV